MGVCRQVTVDTGTLSQLLLEIFSSNLCWLLLGPVQDEGSPAGCCFGQPGGWATPARGIPAREPMEQHSTCSADSVECVVKCRRGRSNLRKLLWRLQLILPLQLLRL